MLYCCMGCSVCPMLASALLQPSPTDHQFVKQTAVLHMHSERPQVICILSTPPLHPIFTFFEILMGGDALHKTMCALVRGVCALKASLWCRP